VLISYKSSNLNNLETFEIIGGIIDLSKRFMISRELGFGKLLLRFLLKNPVV